MRRLVVLFVLLGVMVLVSMLKADSTGIGDPMTLAAIGFVVLAAFTVAELGSALSLPRVTGYIIAGAVLGPSVANILSKTVVAEMTMFNTLALGLIATAAGLELDARQIARLWRTLTSTIAMKVVLGVALVAGALWGVEHITGALSLTDNSSRMAVAFVFGALSIGTSPAIAIAVSSELRTKGRLTDLVLGMAVLKDVVVVIALAVALTVAKQLVGGDHGAHGSHVFVDLAKELGSSLLAGAILGGILIAYLRYVRADMLLVVAGMILVTAEVARALHLELLLVFITAGFVVRNLSKLEHELLGPVQQVSLPVFVIFFTIAGASIDLRATVAIIPIALALALARGVAYVVASHVGGRLGGESATIRRWGWLGYLPQAGVTLGLVGVAARELPSVGATVQSLGMAVVAVNLLLGPITLRAALRAAREAPDGASPADSDAASIPPLPFVQDLAAAVSALRDRQARKTVEELVRDTTKACERVVSRAIEAWAETIREEISQSVRGDLQQIAAREWGDQLKERAEALTQLHRDVRGRLRRLPSSLRLPYDAAPKASTTFQRWRWVLFRGRRWLSGRHDRAVNVAMMARVAFEPEIARQALHVVTQWNRAELALLSDLQRHALGQRSTDETLHHVNARLAQFRERTLHDLRSTVARATSALVAAMLGAGTPDAIPRAQRYSRVEPEVRDVLAKIDAHTTQWARVLADASRTVAVLGQLAELRRRTIALLEGQVITPLVNSLEALEAVLERLRERLASMQEGESLEGLRERANEAFGDQLWSDLESHTARFRTELATHALALEVRTSLEALPSTLEALDPIVGGELEDPTTLRGEFVTVRQRAEEEVLNELVPALDDQVRRVAAQLVGVSNRALEAREVVGYALQRQEEARVTSSIREDIDRALALIERQRDMLREYSASAPAALREDTARVLDGLHESILVSSRRLLTSAGVAPALSFIRRTLTQARTAALRIYGFLASRIASVAGSSISRDLFARYYKQRVDTADLYEFVASWQSSQSVPQQYSELYSIEPLVGPRFFVAHASEVEALVQAERRWLDGQPGSVLVVGGHGSGRTSLLNQCKLQLSSPRLLRPQPLQWRRDIGIFRALGLALGVRHGIGSLARALGATRTAVLLDDLENWFTPDTAGLADLEKFLGLVVRTRDDVFWVASIEADTLAMFEEVMPVTTAFGRVVRTRSLTGTELDRVIEARHGVSGRPLQFRVGVFSRLRVSSLRERDVFFRVLARVSGGNLARALTLWTRSVEVEADGAIVPRLPLALTAALPFVGHLAVEDQALLLLILRFGPLRAQVLAQVLALSRSDIRRRIAYLQAARLLESTGSDGPLQIPAARRPLVLQGLGLMGVAS